MDLKSELINHKMVNLNFSDYESEKMNSKIDFLVKQVLSQNDTYTSSGLPENLKSVLSDWQQAQLRSVQDNESGIRCLLNSWLVTQKDLKSGSFCNATWDNVYCWPPTSLGTTVNRTCSEGFDETEPLYAPHLQGHGYRVCLPNGTWLRGGWTNYTECADSYDSYVAERAKIAMQTAAERELVTNVQYILFFGSILSLIFILSAISIFYYFRLWCDRVTIHIHLMMALMLRYIMLLIITEPFIFNHSTNYRNVDEICKSVLIVYLYATLSSINWMFIQGIYINGKLTTNVFDGRTPFKAYYTIGWLLPFVLMTIWTVIMSLNHDVHCWSGYAAMNEIWIIVCPIIFALIINFVFLINILRIMLTRAYRTGVDTDAMQFRRAAKATIFLFPLLGINNLLFLYSPGGDLHKYFVTLNALFGSTQGIFVAVVYCFLSQDVRAAFQRLHRRYITRRNANRIQNFRNPRHSSHTNCTAASSVVLGQPGNFHQISFKTTTFTNNSQASDKHVVDPLPASASFGDSFTRTNPVFNPIAKNQVKNDSETAE